MLATPRRSAAALALVAVLVAGIACEAPRVADSRAGGPKLVVLLVADQMRGDFVERYGFQWTGGLRRLVDRGAWFSRAAYPYAATSTCVGHATISTGAVPATHGIVGNSWFDREAGRSTSCTGTSEATTISYGAPVGGGHSPSRLLVPTLSDELRAQKGKPGRVVTMSIKERTAIMFAGHRADAVLWFNGTAGNFVTSSAYTSAPVPFVAAALAKRPLSADHDKVWTPSLPAERYLYTDDGLGEKPAGYWTSRFPHELKGKGGTPDAQFYDAWANSPFADDYLGYLATEAVDALKLGQGETTDVLGVSFSVLDAVGHDFGPTSHEVQDVMVRLDRTIGSLLDHLDRTVGAGNYVVALAGDHGASPIPEQTVALGLGGGRLDVAEVRNAATNALAAAFDAGKAGKAGKYEVRFQGGELIFEPPVLEQLRQNRAAAGAVAAAVRAVPGVAAVYFGDDLPLAVAAGDPVARALLASRYPGRSGDMAVVPRPYWLFVTADGSPQPGSATSHGTPYAYDQRVPVVLFGARVKPGEYLQAATPADVAPTLAYLCGITLPRADGRVLAEAVEPSAGPAGGTRAR